MSSKSIPSAASIGALSVLAVVLCTPFEAGAKENFLRGDANVDGQISISDGVTISTYLFPVGDRPNPPLELPCMDSADVNDDGSVNLRDPLAVWGLLFRDSEPLPAPFPEVGPDPSGSDRPSCDSYDVSPPERTDDVIELGQLDASPGHEVAIPVFVTSDRAVEAIQLVLAYDPDVFEPFVHWGQGAVLLDGTYYEGYDARPFEATAVSPEGYLRIGFIPEVFEPGSELPPGTNDVPVFKIRGRVREAVPDGTSILLEGAEIPGAPTTMASEVTYRGDARFVSVRPRVLPAMLNIVADISIFRRADANGDGSVNLSDAQFTLNYLFAAGTFAPPCLDAADANDDGRVDIADAVTTLSFLFDGSSTLPHPYPGEGLDFTEDALSCVGDS